MTDLALGMRLSDYELCERIGEGGFSSVFRATTGDGREVAVKVLAQDHVAHADAISRLEREIAVLAELAHPNIVRAESTTLRRDPFPHFAMELLRGESLAARLERGPMALERARALIVDIASALDAAHTCGVIHRDLKASNVFLAAPSDRPVLLDFGIAKLTAPDTTLTRSRQIVGTPRAMAPEQARGGPITPRTDVYALGALLFHMVTGEPPFADESPTVARHMHRFASRPRPSDQVVLDARVDNVVARAMAVAPEDRYASAGAVATALDELFDVVPSNPDAASHEAVAACIRDLEHDPGTIPAAIDALEAAGFVPVLTASWTALVVRVVADDQERRAAEACAETLRRPGLAIDVRGGRVSTSADAIVGGPLVELAQWRQRP